MILGKVNLTEFAAFVSGQQQSGNGSLQRPGAQPVRPHVRPERLLERLRRRRWPRAWRRMTLGSDTEGSIVYPAANQSVVGLRPEHRPDQPRRRRADLLQPGHARPDDGDRHRHGDAARRLVGVDPEDAHTAETAAVEGTKYTDRLKPDALQGARIGVNAGTTAAPYVAAVEKLRAAGATIVPIPNSAVLASPAAATSSSASSAATSRTTSPSSRRRAPLKSFDEVFDYLRFHPEEGLKYGITRMQPSSTYHLENPAEHAEYEQVRDFEVARSRTFLNTLHGRATTSTRSSSPTTR